MKRLLACLVALMLTLLPCAAMAEEYALYASEHGYTIALPDASWFRLDGQTYAQYQDTHGEAFAGMTIRDADAAQSYADKGVECFFAPDDPTLSIVAEHSNLTMDDETMRQTLDGLQELYEGVMEAEAFSQVDETIGGARYEGIVYTIDGLTKAQLYVRGAEDFSIITFTGFDWESVQAMLAASTFA